MKQLYFIIISLVFSYNLYAQLTISGTVSNVNKQNIPFATIYVDGSTSGTISNENGEFSLDILELPCNIIVSHLGYKTKSLTLKTPVQKLQQVTLKHKEFIIGDVTVKDINERNNNLAFFREQFLGSDYWAENAEILNNDALLFEKKYSFKEYYISENYRSAFISKMGKAIVSWANDSTSAHIKYPTEFTTKSGEALKVYAPKLGYIIHIDLQSFSYTFKNEQQAGICNILGHYYFIDSLPKAKHKQKKIYKNRKRAYYNSRHHFCTSLYTNSLNENGYVIVKRATNDSTGANKLITTNLYQFATMQKQQLALKNLENETFNILYYGKENGTPINTNNSKRGITPVQSEVTFTKNECIIRKNGTIPDNSIIFSPVIGNKKVAAMLPANYKP